MSQINSQCAALLDSFVKASADIRQCQGAIAELGSASDGRPPSDELCLAALKYAAALLRDELALSRMQEERRQTGPV